MSETLKLKQSKFCELYATSSEFFGNGVQSYIEAYEPRRVGNWYNNAKASAYELLTKPYILEHINKLLELRGLNDPFVDKQLELLITQNADFHSKVQAIKEYNALKKRTTKGLEVAGNLIIQVPKEVAKLLEIGTHDKTSGGDTEQVTV